MELPPLVPCPSSVTTRQPLTLQPKPALEIEVALDGPSGDLVGCANRAPPHQSGAVPRATPFARR